MRKPSEYTSSIMLVNTVSDLPDTKLDLKEFTDKIILKALKKHEGNKTATANYLNISRRSLIYRLKQIDDLSI
ncbi:MAG: helix-turn-helix domain-containing protein [Bacillota bacterium]|jgi:transcriptional regulator with PAS, ATPase and Fis domain